MDGDLTVPHSAGAKPTGAGSPTNYDLAKLTPGERLWLWRQSQLSPHRRRLIGDGPATLSQTEAAAQLGLDSSAYWAAENDGVPDRAEALLERIEEPPYTLAAACRIARRRAPVTLTEAAAGAGLGSRPTYHKLELAGDLAVVAFWERCGFTFPADL